MKHVRTVTFLSKLWTAYDGLNREIGTGYIERGRAFVWDNRDVFIQGRKVSSYEITEDVNTLLEILRDGCDHSK